MITIDQQNILAKLPSSLREVGPGNGQEIESVLCILKELKKRGMLLNPDAAFDWAKEQRWRERYCEDFSLIAEVIEEYDSAVYENRYKA